MGEGFGHPGGIVGRVEPRVDFNTLDGAPTREGLDHVVRAAGGEKRAREADAKRMKGVVRGCLRREMEAKKVAKNTVDRRMGDGGEVVAVREEHGRVEAMGSMEWEGELDAAKPRGSIGGVGRVEDLVYRVGPELGAILVGFGTGRFDDSHVAEGDHGSEECGRGVGMERAVDEPKKGGTAEATVIKVRAIWEGHLRFSEAGSRTKGKHGCKAKEKGGAPVKG